MLISKSEIEVVKGRHELSAFIASHGVELKRVGANLVGRCIFHQPDRTPSLIVDPKRQLFNCLGACRSNGNAGGGRGSSGGDLFAFAMKVWGVDFREAFARLGGEVKDELPPPRASSPRRPLEALGVPFGPLASRVPRTNLFGQVVEKQHRQLSESREASEYLESRGLRTRALWRVFKLGYSNGSLLEIAGEGSQTRALLVRMGIVTWDGRERMAGRVVFPLTALNQLPVNLYGRAIASEARPKHMLLPGPRRGLINWNAARRSKRIVLVESPMDLFSLFEAGIADALNLFGVNGVTADLLEVVAKFRVEEVVLGLDSDEAGRKKGPEVAAAFERLGVKVRAIEWPEKDANEVLVKYGAKRTKEIVEKLLAPPAACDLPAPAASIVCEAVTSASADSCSEALAKEQATADECPSLIAAPVAPETEPDAVKEGAGGEAEAGSEAAAPLAPGSASSTAAEPKPDLSSEAMTLTSESRLWRVIWSEGCSASHIRATVRVRMGERADSPSYLDALDLVSAKAREGFARRAAAVTAAEAAGIAAKVSSPDAEGILALRRALEADLIRIAELGEERRRRLEKRGAVSISMTEEEKEKGLGLLRDPEILERIPADIDTVGYVGERTNKLIGYMVGVSRRLPLPLSVVILSPSGSGKSGLAEALEALTPPEEFLSLVSITAQALYYMPKDKLKRKFILIEERAGSLEADYSIRALQSRKKLTRAVPVKDPATGQIETKIFEIEGPAAFLETTTESRLNLENATRCFEIRLDESIEQTLRIQRAQRRGKTLQGLREASGRGEVLAVHHAAQRLLKTVEVAIPYADFIEFPAAWLRTRRDHLRFLNLIEAVTFLKQYQRPLLNRGTGERIGKKLEELAEEELGEVLLVAEVADYASAYELAADLLGETFADLKRPEREFFEAIAGQVAKSGREDFSRREVREATGLPHYRVRQFFERLLDLEYIEPVRASLGMSVKYRLTAHATLPTAVIPGLLTPGELAERLKATASAEALLLHP